ncbi:hypothetical protein ACFLTI_07550 [Bacteroidota bacterium]
MKTKNKIFTLIAVALLMSLSTGTGFSKEGDFTNRVKTIVNRSIDYPAFAIDENIKGVVLLNYSVEADGSITVNEIEASNIRFRDHVIKELSKIKIKGINRKTMDNTVRSKYIFK